MVGAWSACFPCRASCAFLSLERCYTDWKERKPDFTATLATREILQAASAIRDPHIDQNTRKRTFEAVDS